MFTPLVDATGHTLRVGKTTFSQLLCDPQASSAVVSVNNDAFVFEFGNFIQSFASLLHRNQNATFDIAVVIFVGLAAVNQDHFFIRVHELLGILNVNFQFVIQFISFENLGLLGQFSRFDITDNNADSK